MRRNWKRFGLSVGTAAGWLVGSVLTGQAAALWGDIETFLNYQDLNGARVSVLYGTTTKSVYAGEFRASLSDGSSFLAFCTDLLNPTRSGWFTPIDPIPSDNELTNPRWVSGGGERASFIYDSLVNTVHGMPGVDRVGAGTAAGDLAAAALQVAIWEALYDPTPNLGEGAFRMLPNGSSSQDAIIQQASGFLALLASSADPESGWLPAPSGSMPFWLMPVNQDGTQRVAQGLIGGPLRAGTRSVPAPANFGLASLMAGLLGFLSRKRMQI